MTTTFDMNGNAVGYGNASGTEVFNLSGDNNTVLLAGADDTVNIVGGAADSVDLNSTGFTGSVTDVIDLGISAFNQVVSSHDLSDSTISIAGGAGPNSVALVNHGGTTNITLGYGGLQVLAPGTVTGKTVTLNGDATNTVAFTSGAGEAVSIGSAGDMLSSFASDVMLWNAKNSVTGGDEAFTVGNTLGGSAGQSGDNTVTLGNGNDSVRLQGDANTVHLGNGNDLLTLTSSGNTATLGTGSNAVITNGSFNVLTFAAGDAGITDTLAVNGGEDQVAGGDENFVVTNTTETGSHLLGTFGDGNNTIDLAKGRANIVVGKSTANAGVNDITLGRGREHVTLNGGTDHLVLTDSYAVRGYDMVVLNGTLLGTSLSAAGAFDSITLKNDANAALTDASSNGGMHITLNADPTGGFGDISIAGLATDAAAHITLNAASAYTLSVDNTPVGGVTLHFSHGSVDLIGLQVIPNTLIT